MSVALLDVNLLIALFDDGHVHHHVAHDWFADEGESGWASCSMTENGMVRILSNPARVDDPVAIPSLIELLNRFCQHSRHHFWPEDISLRDPAIFDRSAFRGHQQVADIYLLGLAVKNRGRFVTLDQQVPLVAVKGARREHLDVIGADAKD